MKRKLIALLFLTILILSVFQMQNVLSDISTNPASSNNANSPQDFIPVMNIPSNVDTNHNGIVDSLDKEISKSPSNALSPEYIDIIVMLKTKPKESDTIIFVNNGGILTTAPWSYAFYGFGGQISYDNIIPFVEQCPDVLLIEKGDIANGSLAYATRQVGARTYVWNTLGLQGDPNSAIAVLDTGVDGSHSDFAPGYGNQNFQKKIVGWNDQVTFTTSPVDDNGHGSHCSGLTAGDGFFSVDSTGKATATWGVNLLNPGSNSYFAGGMMVNATGPITLKVKWAGTGSASLSSLLLYYGDKALDPSLWSQVGSVSTPNKNSFYTLTYNVASMPSGGYDMYHPLAVTTGTGNLYVTYNMSWPYTPPADGFSAWTGMAPQSKLVGIKVLNNVGSGTSAQFISGINWLISNRVAYHITVASMSLGFGSEQVSVDSALVNLVNSGVASVVAAGNSGSGGNYIYTPGSVDEVTTVAAINQFDNIASYSSQGGTSHSTGNTVKPDIAAPGGSFFGVPLFSADSNTNDAGGWFSEIQFNDSAPMQGTSMATPIVAGAEQIIVQAMGGYNAWSYTRGQALMPKMLLLMTATETYPNLRELATSASSPTLDRGSKDAHEGFGRINVDAAVDAVLTSYQVGTVVSDNLGSPPKLTNISVLGQRLAWARNVQLVAGAQYNFSLSVPSGGDYDLYLYNTTGNAYGEPVIVVKSTTAANGGFEKIIYTPNLSGQFYIVVKLAREDTGIGQFTLTSAVSPDNWAMFHHDLQHSGYSTSTAPSTNNILWSYTTGEWVQSSPA